MSVCSRCGVQFSCAMVDGAPGDPPCWCVAMPAGLPLPGESAAEATCWCPACLKNAIAEHASANNNPTDKR